jgi:hypothetical protein
VKTSGTASALSRRELRTAIEAGLDAARIDASYQRTLRFERWACLIG